MPDEFSLSTVIPSFYYDLISRVAAGAPFLALLLWDRKYDFLPIAGGIGTLLLLAFAGYLVGMVFSTFSGVFLLATKLALRATGAKRFSHPETLSLDSPLLIDPNETHDRSAASTLAKIAAEAVLFHNLLFGFILLVVLDARHYSVAVISGATTTQLIVVGAALLLTVLHRDIVYLVRYDKALTASNTHYRRASA